MRRWTHGTWSQATGHVAKRRLKLMTYFSYDLVRAEPGSMAKVFINILSLSLISGNMELGGRTENLTSTALNEAGHIQCRKDNEHWITGSWICFMFTVSSKKFNLPYALITSDANAFGWLAGLSPFPHCAHVKIGNVSLCFFA